MKRIEIDGRRYDIRRNNVGAWVVSYQGRYVGESKAAGKKAAAAQVIRGTVRA